jgi:hypothetical protein
MQPNNLTVSLLLFFVFAQQGLCSQAAASRSKPEPDVLIFTDGEKMIGHLERATDSSVVFKSDMIGEVTVDWSEDSGTPFVPEVRGNSQKRETA